MCAREGLPVYHHSCSNLGPLVPALMDAGVDMLNPLEAKAGMDPLVMTRCAFDGPAIGAIVEGGDAYWRESSEVVRSEFGHGPMHTV